MNALREITPDAVLHALSARVGPANGATVRELAAQVVGGAPSIADERAVRHAVVALRRAGHPVCATPDEGYHSPACAEDLQRTCIHLVQRAMTTLTQVSAMRRVALPDLYGQLGLPAPESLAESTEDTP